MGLSVAPNVPSILKTQNSDRFYYLQMQKTDGAKLKRKLYNKVLEHRKMKLFVKEGGVVHDYGITDTTLTQKFKCGSTQQKRTSNRSCPLNSKFIDKGDDKAAPKSNAVDAFDDASAHNPNFRNDSASKISDLEDICFQSCTCLNYSCHQRQCPENVRNRKRAKTLDDPVTPTSALRTPLLKMTKRTLNSPFICRK
uniref:Uncharacterized protein n=1 Tax=Amphimedon queenslandica TaxID=400682 RepID=A0A1X7V352_AMPQE